MKNFITVLFCAMTCSAAIITPSGKAPDAGSIVNGTGCTFSSAGYGSVTCTATGINSSASFSYFGALTITDPAGSPNGGYLRLPMTVSNPISDSFQGGIYLGEGDAEFGGSGPYQFPASSDTVMANGYFRNYGQPNVTFTVFIVARGDNELSHTGFSSITVQFGQLSVLNDADLADGYVPATGTIFPAASTPEPSTALLLLAVVPLIFHRRGSRLHR